MSRSAILPAILAAVLLPAALSAAQSYTWRNVPIVGGGFVPGIVFNTSEPNLIYARTDIGGGISGTPPAAAGSRSLRAPTPEVVRRAR